MNQKYDDTKLPFDPSLMVHFRKRFTPEILGEINEMILDGLAQTVPKKDEENNSDSDDKNRDNSDYRCDLCTVSN